MWGYKLDEKRHSDIRVALSARDGSAGSRDAVQTLAGVEPRVLNAGE